MAKERKAQAVFSCFSVLPLCGHKKRPRVWPATALQPQRRYKSNKRDYKLALDNGKSKRILRWMYAV